VPIADLPDEEDDDDFLANLPDNDVAEEVSN
jgi:hypothetical protein